LNIRPKLIFLTFAVALAALLLLSGANYWQHTRSLEAMLRDNLRRDADWIALRINSALDEHESRLQLLAETPAMREYLRCRSTPTSALVGGPQAIASGCRPQSKDEILPDDLRAAVMTFSRANQKHYESIAGKDSQGKIIFRVTIGSPVIEVSNSTPSVILEPGDAGAPGSQESVSGVSPEERSTQTTPQRSLIGRGSAGATVQYTLPVLASERGVVVGALVADLRLDQLFKEQSSDVVGALNGSPTGMQTSRLVIILHRLGEIYYHSNEIVNYQPVANALPEFRTVANAMMAGETGARFYDASDGDRWLASYRPLGQHDLSIAVVTDYSRALAPARDQLLLNILLSLAIALLAAAALTFIAQRNSGKSLRRLTQDAVAIARGHLDQQLVVSSAENQPLADSMNVITARLREQLAREAESRQFDSFLRLSAMLTHDLKNTITALSLGVSNMERNFARADFRADAMSSLKEVAAKLQKLVSKLSEPVNTMSGEHQMPRAIDLVPLIQRVLESLAPASTQQHEIELQLPEQLIAVVEPDRMEKVVENLVINALEAMGVKQGKLTIAGGSAGERKVFFSIGDNGSGMTRSFQEHRLFRPFATTKPTGVGLGLYTCREVVRAHGGSIDVTSEAGVGTTFRVVLPSVHPGE